MESVPTESQLETLKTKRSLSSVMALRRACRGGDARLSRELLEYVYNQETTHICEVLDGVVRTEVHFAVSDGELYTLDENGPLQWRAFHQNNLDYAEALAAQNTALKPYLQIARAEFEEGELQRRIVAAGRPATMAVLSPCGDDLLPPEALELLGRDPARQRAMLRVSVFDGRNLTIYARSIDHLSLKAAKRLVIENFGLELTEPASSADVLRSRLVIDGAWHDLADELTPPQHGPDTHRFVLAHADLLGAYFEALNGLAFTEAGSDAELAGWAEELKLDFMASFKERLEGRWVSADSSSVTQSGNRAREAGITFSGCDMVVGGSVKRLGYGAPGNELKSECLTCPGCRRVVSADEEYFKAGFLRCPECLLTVPYRQSASLPKVKQKRYNQNKESLYQWWTRRSQEYRSRQKTRQAQDKS